MTTQTRIAYMPLATYPEAVPDAAILSGAAFGVTLGCALHVTTFAVEIPRPASPMTNLLIDVPSLIRATEDRSRAECERLQASYGPGRTGPGLHCASRRLVLSGVLDAARPRPGPSTSRSCLGPAGRPRPGTWHRPSSSGRDVPPSWYRRAPGPIAIDHIAIAWDGGRFAARALGDALPLLAEEEGSRC